MATFTASEEETNKVYDRQIRLWGADAQRRIQASRVLFLGLGPANVELVKNLVLAGFSATIADHRKVDAASLGYNFFADAESIGKSAAATRALSRARYPRGGEKRQHSAASAGA